MKIGLYFTAGKGNGGVYQYSLAFLEALASIPGHTYVVITTSNDIPDKFFHDARFTVVDMAKNRVSAVVTTPPRLITRIYTKCMTLTMRLVYKLQLNLLIDLATRISQRKLLQTISAQNLDLLIFPAGTDISYLSKVRTIVAIHDVQHRLHPEFPELSKNGRWEYRENYYRRTCQKATKIMVDSEVGKEDVLSCYPDTDPKKIVILPFLPPPYLNPQISSKVAQKSLSPYKLSTPFIYYPAQFWPHKNHLHLIEAVHLLHERGHKISLALTGSTGVDYSTYQAVCDKIKEYKLTTYCKYLGYVENEVVSALYKEALALVMPTYLGPTNIPIIEAWIMGTPVITSDIRGCREQAKGAGILADPYQPREIAAAIEQLLLYPKQGEEIIREGHKKIASWTYPDFARRVDQMLKTIPSHVE